MSKTSLAVSEWASSGFKDFVIESLVDAPNTSITGRAQVSNSLKPVMGIERLMIRAILPLPKEVGSAGEQVWEADTKDSRVRFVGNWIQLFSNSGSRIQSQAAADYLEVTFFGTGLNIIGLHSNWNTSPTYKVDGGSSVSVGIVTSSGVLQSRTAYANQVIPVVSGLTAGLHTVRIDAVATTAIDMGGVEILNERSNVLINTGSAFSGMKKQSILTTQTSAYNSSITGTKGGRVVKYALDGAISEVATMVDSTQLNLTSANHANEEIVRVISFKEFGTNRSDDYSNIPNSSSNLAFTLDDDSTSLIATGVRGNPSVTDILDFNTDGAWVAITFIGTGLDIIRKDAGSTGTNTTTLALDGTTLGTDTTAQSLIPRTYKIVSGLPYGTHTVKITRTAAVTNDTGLLAFLIYQPKKPTLPANAVELADFNVLANYVTSTNAVDTVGQGVLRKANLREFIYIGSWSAALSVTNYQTGSGFATTTTTNGNSFQYTFFGTGFEFRHPSDPANTSSVQVVVDGLNATTANFPSATFTYVGPASFSSSTGILSQNGTNGYGRVLSVSGLALGLHTVKFTNGAAAEFDVQCLDIITPIHSHDKGFFKRGSLSLQDSRAVKPTPIPEKSIDLSKAKAWVHFNETSGKIIASFNVSAVVNIGTGINQIYFEKPFKNAANMAISGMQWDDSSTGVLTLRSGTSFEEPKANKITVQTVTMGNSASSCEHNYVIVFGELENEDTQ